MSESKHIVVAGAGILGASIAWHLAAQGAKVTVIDRTAPASEASGRSFGWINATHEKRPYRYHLLNRMGVTAWSDVANKLSLPVQWGGSLAWSHDPKDVARQAQDTALQQAWGSPAQLLGPTEMAGLEPQVAFHGAAQAGFSELDGWVDAGAATRRLLAAAEVSGATCHFPCELTGAAQVGGRLAGVATSQGNIDATHLVLACGANVDVTKQAAGFALPQQPSAGVIVISIPLPPAASRVLAANGVLVQQRADGRLVMGEARPLAAPEANEQIGEVAHRIIDSVSQFLPGVTRESIESTTLGWRPIPKDGFPAIGRSPTCNDIYTAVTHSGVTLAIILGRLITLEILQDRRIELLAPYRPERFLQGPN